MILFTYINFETYMLKQKKSKDFRFKLEYLEMMSYVF